MCDSLNNEGIWFVFGYTPCLHVPDEVHEVFSKNWSKYRSDQQMALFAHKRRTPLFGLSMLSEKKPKGEFPLLLVLFKGESCTSIQ